MKLFCLAILLVAGAAPGAALAQKGPEKALPGPPDTVRLRYAWPLGLTARVTTSKFRARTSAGKSDTTDVRIAYSLTVRPHARGRLVQFHDFEVPGVAELANPDVSVEDFTEMQERMSAVMPSLIVDTAGEFVAIERIEALQREMEAMLGPATRANTLKPEARDFIARLRSPEVLTALAEYEWNALVGTWLEADFVVGLSYETEYEMPFPLFAGVMLPVVQEFAAVARVPCTEQDTQKRCVELESFLYHDEETFRGILDRIMSQVAPGDSAPMPKIDEFDMETEIRLIAEPATLIPYRLSVTKRISFSFQERGVTTDINQVETKTSEYRYIARTTPRGP